MARGTLLLLCSLLGTGSSVVRVDVRCYCNLPLCAATGNMCRSSVGICVSETGDEDVLRKHACIELLTSNSDRQMAVPECHGNVYRRCCTDDMCNYPEENAINPSPALSSDNGRLNKSHVTGHLSNHDSFLRRGGLSSNPRPFFRLLMVAVPVAGGLVLIGLVAMAVKMLRVESRRQSRLKPSETRVVYRKNQKRFLSKSTSCVILGNSLTTTNIRSYASLGSLRRSASLTMSVDSVCTDSSKENYFVFDV